MKVYCPTCGSGTSYAATKPKFCSSCGEAFSALNKTPAKRVFKTDPRNPVATIREEVGEEEFEMPNMDKLDIDINASRLFNVTSLRIWPVPIRRGLVMVMSGKRIPLILKSLWLKTL